MKDTAYTRQPWFAGRVAADRMYSTAADYARFLLLAMQTESKERLRIHVSLKDSLCASLKTAPCPEDFGSGLGWQVLKWKGDTLLAHTGRHTGLYTFAYFSPATRTGAVFLTNGENGNRVIVPILRSLGTGPDFLTLLEGALR